jgi:hypothetical protein
MSARTAAEHKPTELRHEGTRDGIALFSSASKSRPNDRNWTYLDVETRQGVCECEGANRGLPCWHLDHLAVAFAMTCVAAFLATLDDATLEVVGLAAAAIIEHRCQTITDLAVYWGAKREWCGRRRARREAAALLARLPDPAVVLARRSLPCPDCGEPARHGQPLCDDCMAELLASRVAVAA